MFEIYNNRKQFWQWDSGQRLIVSDELACSEIHFCNGTTDCSLVCEIYIEDGLRLVNVPNILLQSDNLLRVFAYVCDSDENYTKYMQLFSVFARSKPDDYVYTETEIVTAQGFVEKAVEEAKANGEFKGDPGKDGETPYIKSGYWWIGDTNTNVKAEGVDGKDGQNGKDGAAGKDGQTPYIKDGYWWIGNTNTNVLARGENGDDYVLTEADKQEMAQIVLDESVGDIEASLDEIIAIQESLMIPSGDGVAY